MPLNSDKMCLVVIEGTFHLFTSYETVSCSFSTVCNTVSTLAAFGLDFPFFEAIATNLSRCSYLVSIPPLEKALIAVGFKMLFVAGGKGVGISPVSKKPYHMETCGVNIFMWGEKRGLA